MDENKIKKDLHLLQDTHSSMAHQCWIASSLEDQSSLESREEIQKALSTYQGDFLQLLSDGDDLFELVEVLHGACLKDEEEICKLTQDLLTTQDSLKSTQCALQDSKMEIKQLHEKLQRSHLPSYISFRHPHKADCIIDHMEEPREMVDHDMHSVLHVLEDCANKLNENQSLDISQRKFELFP